MMATSAAWSVDAVRALGTTTDILTAAAVLGIGRTTAYQLARDGQFPVPVTRVGRRYIVGVPHLLRAIGATDRPAN
jgi:predicted DNA-binding transcriptional regulator AlpA